MITIFGSISFKRLQVVDLPVPIPPVNPMIFIFPPWGLHMSRTIFNQTRILSSKSISSISVPLDIERFYPNFEKLILFEDEKFIAVNKPPYILSVPGRVPQFQRTKKRHLEWADALQATCSRVNNNAHPENQETIKILQKLLTYHNIPRNPARFRQFLQSQLSIFSESLLDQIWREVSSTDKQLHQQDLQLIPKSMISMAQLVEVYTHHLVYPVHRLDQETSGILLFAKSVDACAQLCKQFADRTVAKSYIARVAKCSPCPLPPQCTLDPPLRLDWPNRPKQIVDFQNGKSALTHVTILNHIPVSSSSSSSSSSTTTTSVTHRETEKQRFHIPMPRTVFSLPQFVPPIASGWGEGVGRAEEEETEEREVEGEEYRSNSHSYFYRFQDQKLNDWMDQKYKYNNHHQHQHQHHHRIHEDGMVGTKPTNLIDRKESENEDEDEDGRGKKKDIETILSESFLVRLRPLTGRSHQLRVHLSHIGYPILGDSLYSPPLVYQSSDRLLLHSETLGFFHPYLNKHITITSEV